MPEDYCTCAPADGTFFFSYDENMATPEMNRPVMGTWFLISGIALLVYDGFNDWDTIWATAVGLKLLVVAVIFLLWEPLRRLDERQRAKREQMNHAGHKGHEGS